MSQQGRDSRDYTVVNILWRNELPRQVMDGCNKYHSTAKPADRPRRGCTLAGLAQCEDRGNFHIRSCLVMQ